MVKYKCPPIESKDARFIWIQAGLPAEASEEEVIDAIDAWSIWHAYIYSKDDNNEFHIQWVNPNGYIIKTNYDTFRRWILCACQGFPSDKI